MTQVICRHFSTNFQGEASYRTTSTTKPTTKTTMDNQLHKTRFACSETVATIWDITPDLAKIMLESSRGNRVIRNPRVRDWMRSLHDGTWEVVNDDICFDVDGYLINGHHRLIACVESGIAFRCGIKQGLSKTAYQKMDCGLARRIHERADMAQYHVEVLRLAARLVLLTQAPSVAELDRIGSTGLLNASEKLTEYCPTRAKFFSCASMRLAACAHIVYSKSEDHVEYTLFTYKSLVLMRLSDQSAIAQSLVKQHINGDAKANNVLDALMRGLRVFDYEKRNVQRLMISSPTRPSIGAELVHLLNFKRHELP